MPADEHWLARLLAGFELADDVGLAYGPYRPRAGAPAAVRRELDGWFASLAPDGRPRVDRTTAPRGPGRRDVLHRRQRRASRAAAWERVPFREVPYAEDQALALDMLRAGFAKAYVPDAAVVHSHEYATVAQFRRSFDEWRGLREVHGWVEPARPVADAADRPEPACAPTCAACAAACRRATLVREGARSLRHWTVRAAGAVAGSRADRLPPRRARRGCSLEGRDTFEPSVTAMSTRPPHPPVRKGRLADLWRRARLTLEYHGAARARVSASSRSRCAPTPLGPRLGHGRRFGAEEARARRWYREQWRPVTVVIPTYGDPALVEQAVASVRKTTERKRVARRGRRRRLARPAHRERLKRAARRAGRADGGQRRLRRGRQPRHRAGRAERRRRRPQLRRRSRARAGSSACSTRPTARDDIGIVGPEAALPRQADPVRRLLPQPRRAGVVRPPLPLQGRHPPRGQHHRARDRRRPAPACTSSARCSTRSARFDEAYGMAYEDMDWCLRGWEAGLAHLLRAARLAAPPRVADAPDRARRARARLPAAASGSAGSRTSTSATCAREDGSPADRLRDRGHRRRRRPPRHLRAPQPAGRARPRRRSCSRSASTRTGSRSRSRRARSRTTTTCSTALEPLEAIKVATWWNTAAAGLAGLDAPRHPRVLRPGHRDVATTPTRPRCRRTCSTATGTSSAT